MRSTRRIEQLGSLGWRTVLGAIGLTLSLTAGGWCQERPRAQNASGARADEPVMTVTLPSIDQFYSDLKLMFDLANDRKGYQTFKETIDEFLVGVERNKPGGFQVFSGGDGLHSIATLPVKNETEFKKYLENLYDLDVKTAPPPRPAQAHEVPREVQAKMKSLHLQPDERVVFSLFDGFLRYESGNVHIGDSLDEVRRVKGGLPVDRSAEKGIVVALGGNQQSVEERRSALDKTRERLLSTTEKKHAENKGNKRSDKTADDSPAALPFEKALVNLAFGDIGGIFAESSRTRLVWTTSHEKKEALVHAAIEAEPGSSLAKRIEKIGHLTNTFAGIPTEGCVATIDFNVPADPGRKESTKKASREARTAAHERARSPSNQHQRLSTEQWDALLDLADDMSEMSQHCGFLRTVSHGRGSLTTVGGFLVPDTARVIEILQKFKGREGVTVELKIAHAGPVDIHKVTFEDLKKDAPGVVDREGAVYIGTGEKTVWYASGEKALERLKQAVEEAKGGPGTGDVAIRMHAQLLPLAEAWNQVNGRWKNTETREQAREKGQEQKKSGDKKEKKVADTVSAISDLNLPGLAVQAFEKGKDRASLTLTKKGSGLELNEEFDEGVLRFIGLALSRFVKENLEE